MTIMTSLFLLHVAEGFLILTSPSALSHPNLSVCSISSCSLEIDAISIPPDDNVAPGLSHITALTVSSYRHASNSWHSLMSHGMIYELCVLALTRVKYTVVRKPFRYYILKLHAALKCKWMSSAYTSHCHENCRVWPLCAPRVSSYAPFMGSQASLASRILRWAWRRQ
jgi:hypothetical protein